MSKILVSACLLGVECRYKSDACPCQKLIELGKDHTLIPVCPEQAGGLPTPRLPSERRGEQVVNRAGENVTEAFRRGAELALERALREGCRLALLKARSPSCGSGRIYDGSFTATVIPGDGVTAEMLKKSGITVCNETEFAY